MKRAQEGREDVGLEQRGCGMGLGEHMACGREAGGCGMEIEACRVRRRMLERIRK